MCSLASGGLASGILLASGGSYAPALPCTARAVMLAHLPVVVIRRTMRSALHLYLRPAGTASGHKGSYVQEVVAMMAPQETAAAATARVAAAVGGGGAGGVGDDDDDDDILHSETLPLSLRDPMSNTRIRRAARIVGAKSPRAFDLDYFLESAKRSRKWQCPITCAPVSPAIQMWSNICSII